MTGPADILRRLEQAGPPDRELIARFVAQRDQAAFADLVRRHGPLVLGACRRVTGHAQDAEDAFQAVFLVLARKAGRIGNPDLLGNWLFGVAVRVAGKARRSAARRRAREVVVSPLPDPPAEAAPVLGDLGPILDEELAALPAWYREAILLCDLRGTSREEAAALLGVPEGTLSSRLANGRKKLAARLRQRGVSLSVAGVVGVVGQAEAGIMVSNELVTKTCGLVADWAAGGAVPDPFARLAEGGFAVRKTLLLGALMVAAVAGVVVAAGSGDDPNAVMPPKPAVVAQGGPFEQPKAEEKPAKNVEYTTRPRMRAARDYALGTVYSIAWRPDGEVLAFQGTVKGLGDVVQLEGNLFDPDAERPRISLEPGIQFIGFTPDGKELLTAQREYQLVSGLHKLQYIGLKREKPGAAITTKPTRSVDLDADSTAGYSFAVDGKTYRTLDTTTAAPGIVSRVRVTSVDAATGKTLKALLTVEDPAWGYGLSPRGERLAVLTPKGVVTVYDVNSGKPIWSKPSKFPPLEGSAVTAGLEFSQDAARLFVTASQQPPLVFDAESGKLLPALEKAELISSFTSCLSADGRLLVICADHSTGNKSGNAFVGRFLSVWDTDTGKLLKRWAGHIPSAMAFHPIKPILAILEPNGENTTRLGLWDFSAEDGKK